LDKQEFINELGLLIDKCKGKLSPYEVLCLLLASSSCFAKNHTNIKETAMLTIETYREYLEKAYSFPDIPNSN
jgi:hypothetical protein